MNEPNPVGEWVRCYWGVVLDVPLAILNFVFWVTTGNVVSLIAAIFIGAMGFLCLSLGRNTKRVRQETREIEARLYGRGVR